MDENIKQRIRLKFCIANGISCAESLKLLQKAYGKSPRSGRPSKFSTEVNIAKVKKMMTENRN